MKAKLFLALLLACFILPFASTSSNRSSVATATAYSTAYSMPQCSGDLCGCGVIFQECVADCPPSGPARTACLSACRRENIQCAKDCCAVP